MYIENGYIKLAKKIKKSDIYRMPPFYREVWINLLLSVRFADQTRTVRGKKIVIQAGQIYTTYEQISEDLHWYDNKKKCQYSKRQVKKALEFFRKAEMVTTEKHPRGVIITICNYKEYQTHENYTRNLGHQICGEKPIKSDSYENKNQNLGHQDLDLGHQKFLQGL